MTKSPPKVLFDTSVLMHGVLGVPAIEKQKIKWGDIEQELDILRTIRKPEKAGNQEWLSAQIECLPTLGRLVKEQKIIAYRSAEIHMELFRRSKIANATLYAFTDCEFAEAKSPVERSRIFQSDIFTHSTAQAFREYCIWLLALKPDSIETLIDSSVARGFPQFELDNLRNLDLFRGICGTIEQKHYPDAYHLWTAEVNGFEYYVMDEKKFRQEFEQKGKAKLSCRIVCPQELLEAIGVDSLDPIPLEHGRFYGLM